MKILLSLVSWRKLHSAENKEMPTGAVSGCRQICLAVVGVHNKARLLTHLHTSLACLQLPNTLCISVHFFFVSFFTGAQIHAEANTPDNSLNEVRLEESYIYHGGFTSKGWGLDRGG